MYNVIFLFWEMSAQFAKPFFCFEKCQRILQSHFSVLRNASAFCKSHFSILRNASAFCKSIFLFWEMSAHFAKTFFCFEKCQRILQKHFSVLGNASAFCKGIFLFWEMPAHFVSSRKKAMNLFFYQQERHAIKLLLKATSTILSHDGLFAINDERWAIRD